MRQPSIRVYLFASLVFCLSGAIDFQIASAAVFVPAGLQPGDTYQLVFVTQGTRDATSANINDYNAFVQQQAELSHHTAGISWKAIASTSGMAASNNAVISTKVYNLNGKLVANGYDAFWGTQDDGPLLKPINYDQFGNETNVYVWTGTNSEGGGAGSFQYLGGSGSPAYGRSPATDLEFISFQDAAKETEYSLYALSEVLTVPADSAVPEPASVTIWLGAVGIGWWGLRRRGAISWARRSPSGR